MNVQIVSAHAILHGRPSILWHGDVELPNLASPTPVVSGRPEIGMSEQEINEYLFRYFNRVDEEDGDRLRDCDFALPSLSVGDLLHWGSKTWRVAGTGFELLTGSDEYGYALAMYGTRTALTGGDEG